MANRRSGRIRSTSSTSRPGPAPTAPWPEYWASAPHPSPRTSWPWTSRAASLAEQGVLAEVVEVKQVSELAEFGEAKLKGKIVFFNRPFDAKLINTFTAYGEGSFDLVLMARAVDEILRGVPSATVPSSQIREAS